MIILYCNACSFILINWFLRTCFLSASLLSDSPSLFSHRIGRRLLTPPLTHEEFSFCWNILKCTKDLPQLFHLNFKSQPLLNNWFLKNLAGLGCPLQTAFKLTLYSARIAGFKVTKSRHLSHDRWGPVIQFFHFLRQAWAILKKKQNNKVSSLEFR